MVHDTTEGDEHIIHLSGRLDDTDRAAFLTAARALLAGRRGGIVDATGLEVWDLATIQLILSLRRDVAASGEQVRVVGVREEAATVQAALGLTAAQTNSLSWEVW